ncbi:MAG: hypothetical protein ACFFCS_15990 [Candidatus Hodarchaeota archaeon]
MNNIIAIIDTNFFLGIKTVTADFDELISFLESWKDSLDENRITAIIPFRVLSEVERFDMNLAKYLESNFQVYPPVDTKDDKFFLNIKWVNQHRKKKLRWFHVGEVTDIEILTVGKKIHDSYKNDKDSTFQTEIWIVSNDEGIEKSSAQFLHGMVKVKESATFLGYILGVSNVEEFQDDVEEVSKRVFKYFTTFRVREGRKPVSQLNSFYSEMLNSIRMARKDIQSNFDKEVLGKFEQFITTGKDLEKPLDIYERILSLIKKSLEMGEAGYLNRLDTITNKISISLSNLSLILKESADFTRFYNYIAIYLIKIYLNAFKVHFTNHSLDCAFNYIQLAKVLAQGMLNQENMARARVLISMGEAMFLHVTGHKDDDYIDDSTNDLLAVVNSGKLPTFIPEDLINLLIVVSHLKKGGEIKIKEEDPSCEYRPDCLSFSREYFKVFAYLLEDFCDEITSYGNHGLAQKLYRELYKLLPAELDDHARIEGKIYLNCLIIKKGFDDCIKGISLENLEKTHEPLQEENLHENYINIKDASKAYRKRVKVLSFKEAREGNEKLFHCWVYPLKSKFIVKMPANIKIHHPFLLKDFKIQSGSIKIISFNEEDREKNKARGMIDLSPDCSLETEYYNEKFFTLDLI